MARTSLVFVLLLFVAISSDATKSHSAKPKERRLRNLYSNSPQSTEITNDNRKLDPFGSWSNFLGHATNSRNSKKGDRGKGKPRNKTPSTKKSTHPCPPGPPGPPGPQGPAGAVVTEAHMMMEFRNLVRESAQKRSRRLADNISLMASGIPDLVSAFHVELRNEIQIARKTLHELNNYKSHVGSFGTFVRGNDIEYKNGRYIARYTGVYQFSCSLHVLRARDANLRPRDSIKLQICINSLCDHNTSLLTVTGVNSNSKVFTISLHGILLLKAGQYTSVFVENSSGNPITISSQSSFSGILLGA
ncbi:adipolin-like isoform X2 [Actinia tenebrosa]|uniref:Adipolin-like isoform X2 n=1 Tax=Actinia tenebrosa TaxID=6105 RepID=A0A6P8HP96_ACTTE|nr:adipolin-like isoform X2 [Actinia tenebrosa]